MGKTWYTNEFTEKLIDDSVERIPEHFYKGRLKRNKKCYNNGIIQKYFMENEEIPLGFTLGGISKQWSSDTQKHCKRCGSQFYPNNKRHFWCEACYNEVHKEVECPVCKRMFRQKFQKETCCSKKCAKILQGNLNNPDILKKIANTNIQRYGYANPLSNPDIQKKAQNNRIAVTKNNLSKDATTIYNTLKNDGIHCGIEKEKIFEGCVFKSYLPFDFYIPKGERNSELLIEYDGEHHTKPIKFRKNQSEYKAFIHTQITDWIKDKYCIENSLPLIRVPSNQLTRAAFKEIYTKSYVVGLSQRYDKRLDVFDINECDLVNYKEPTFTIYAGVSCTFKCDKESGCCLCQNSHLINQPVIHYDIDRCIQKYHSQQIANNISFQGLEPLDNLKQILWFIYYFRQHSNDTIILWTGYTEEECEDLTYLIKEKMKWRNIIIKFGRYIPGDEPHYDHILGVNLASDNQHAVKIT